jgi:hypothetical protein
MERRKPTTEESTESPFIEEIIQLDKLGLGACQGCGKRLLEGVRCEIYAFRACGSSVCQAGQARCVDCPVTLDSLATLGARELVVEGRVARCVDQGRQCSWRVLLDPETRSVSPCHVTAAFDAPAPADSLCGAAGCFEPTLLQGACGAERGRCE